MTFLFTNRNTRRPTVNISLVRASPTTTRIFTVTSRIHPKADRRYQDTSGRRLSRARGARPYIFIRSLTITITLHRHNIIPTTYTKFSLNRITTLAFTKTFSAQTNFRLIYRHTTLVTATTRHRPNNVHTIVGLSTTRIRGLTTRTNRSY